MDANFLNLHIDKAKKTTTTTTTKQNKTTNKVHDDKQLYLITHLTIFNLNCLLPTLNLTDSYLTVQKKKLKAE